MADETFDYRELLKQPMSNFPDRPNLPGNKTFYGKLIGMSATVSAVKGTPGLHLDIKLTDPGSDVPREEMDMIAAAGFSLADYSVGKNFWITSNSMIFLRRFLVSLGFPENASFAETLKLDENGIPTAETQDVIRGLDVAVVTPFADEQGRVFLNNVENVTGMRR